MEGSKTIFQYGTKVQRAEVTWEERVSFPVERTSLRGGDLPRRSNPLVTSRPVLFRAEKAQAVTQTQTVTTCTLSVQVVQLIVHIVRVVRTHRFKSLPVRAAPSLARVFRCWRDPALASSRADTPLATLAPPSPWWHMGSPPPSCAVQHLESWPPGISVHRHVCIMYVPRIYNARVHQQTYMVYTFLEMYIHECTCLYISANVYTRLYMVCTFRGINVYVNRSDVYVYVYAFIYTFWII